MALCYAVRRRLRRFGAGSPHQRKDNVSTPYYWTTGKPSPKAARAMHASANPTRFLAIARPLTPWLLGLVMALLLVGAWAGLMLVPGDYTQGEAARILDVQVDRRGVVGEQGG